MQIIAAIELSDPLRKNAKEMLGFFKGEGVTVKIISGDYIVVLVDDHKISDIYEEITAITLAD